MNTILLHPTDILFFRDGRPMSGSLSGHGSAWPLPNVINHAFHAALHRAEDFKGAHKHVPGRSSSARDFSESNRANQGRLFGSLTTAGPFPVDPNGQWFFPRPLDAGLPRSAKVTFQPLAKGFDRSRSSLPQPLKYPLANTEPPNKYKLEPWFNAASFEHYMNQEAKVVGTAFANDDTFSDAEHSIGIGLDPATGTQDGERFYSASYLRLREDWKLGVLAIAKDKEFHHQQYGDDLIRALLNGDGTEIIAGGQQRVCSAVLATSSGEKLPLPVGKTDGFAAAEVDGVTKWLVKWVLLTPAVFPKISEGRTKTGQPLNPHTGGWLPNWIATRDQEFEGVPVRKGAVLLLDGPGREKAKRKHVACGNRIPATLVAAMTGKPIPVTGYALPNSIDPERPNGGAKSTHLAVPAGAVYYFECDDAEAAKKLANALNWHGAESPTTIRNRRSTLMGEKGFGIGVCGTWKFHSGTRPSVS
jgi:hypothetical protein